MTHRRTSITILWLAGVFAAAQLAKFSVLAPSFRGRPGFPLPTIGLLVSLIEVGGALFGFMAGMALGRLRLRTALLVGIGLIVVTTLVEAVAQIAPLLLAARATEGVGYLLIVITAPTMIVSLTEAGSGRSAAMLLWSSFMPIGIGFGSVLTGVVAWWGGANMAMLMWAVVGGAIFAVVARLPSPPAPERKMTWPTASAGLLSAGFGFYTLFLCTITGLLPVFLHDRHAVTGVRASMISGLVGLLALPGSLIALAVLRALADDYRRGLALLLLSLLAAALGAPRIFTSTSVAGCATAAVAILFLAGIARAFIFARLPHLSGARAGGDGGIASAQGLFTQFGAAGALTGPPLGALIARDHGWSLVGLGLSLCIILMAGLIALAERVGACAGAG